jgi:glycosyltransferase involved in cell wall biosynthesis
VRIALFVHHALTQSPAGIGQYDRRLALELARLDSKVHFLLLCFRAQAPADRWGLPDNATFVELPFSSRLAGNLLWPFAFASVDRWIPEADLLHVPEPEWPIPTRIPLVVTIHDLFPERRPDRYKRIARWRRRRALLQAAQAARRILAVSEATRRDVIDYLQIEPERVVCIHPGAPDHFQAPSTDAQNMEIVRQFGIRRPYFLFVGRQDPRKNLDTLFHAFAEARRRSSSNPSLVLVGSHGPGFRSLLRLLRDLGLQDDVQFTGYLQEEQRKALLLGATALVYPSLTEGFGFPPLEAMAAGVPVIASSAGAIPEVTGDAALLFDPSDSGLLADHLVKILDDCDLRQELVRRGESRPHLFSWAATASKTLAVYRSVIESAA